MLHNSYRAAFSTIAIVVSIIVIILIAATAGALYIFYGHTGGTPSTSEPSAATSITLPSSTLSTSSTFSSTSTHSSTTTIATTPTISKNTTTSETTTSSTTSAKNYALKLLNSGSGALLTSRLTTPQAATYFPADGPCCGGTQSDVVYYNDSGNMFAFQGDLNPGRAWLYADSSGLTVNYETCPDPSNPLNCGPHHEHLGDSEAFNDASLYGDLGNIPSNATLFTITADLPNHPYYQNCQLDSGNGAPGCSYETTPFDAAGFALVANGYYLVLSFAETCNSPCTTNSLEVSAYVSQGGSSIDDVLNTTYFASYTPIHRLTISTDRKSYLNFYFDSTLIYSNRTMPVNINAPISELELSQRTSINNETESVTWSNLSIYSSSTVSVKNVPAGSTVMINGSNGFAVSQRQATNGTAVIDVSIEPYNLSVTVIVDEKTINYPSFVNSGSVLDLVLT
jgi:hypothetical protein